MFHRFAPRPGSGEPQNVAWARASGPGNTSGIFEFMSLLISAPSPGVMKIRLLAYENWIWLTIVPPNVVVNRAAMFFDGWSQVESTVGKPVSPHKPPSAPKFGAGFFQLS